MAGDKNGGIQLARFGQIVKGQGQAGGIQFLKHVHQCTKRVRCDRSFPHEPGPHLARVEAYCPCVHT
jgi:hypothetical protein